MEQSSVSVILERFSIDVLPPENWLQPKTERRSVCLLQPLDAIFPGGEISAILGGSGSGKTTLLNVIAGRYDRSTVVAHGSLSFARASLTAQQAATAVKPSCSVAYVTQDDFLHPHLTVRETLEYGARLKIPAAEQDLAEQVVHDVTMELGLKECMESVVGSDDGTTSSRGISGGEKRRVSIALQILTHPQVLCADEPTSGLDSFTAVTVMECLRRLTTHRTTVICSIHQPRADIFSLFHSALLLSAGGQPVYCGPVANMLDYFASIGYPCPLHANPADYFLDLTAVDRRFGESRKRVSTLLASYQSYAEAHPIDTSHLVTIVRKAAVPTVSWIESVVILLARQLSIQARDRSHLFGAIAQATIEGLLVMAIFWNLPLTEEGISSRSGLMYVAVSVQYYLLMIVLIDRYSSDFVRYIDRELQDGIYHPSAYFVAHWLQSIPVLLAQSLIYSSFIYYGCNLRHGFGHFLVFLLVHVALACTVNALAWVCISIVRNFALTSLIGNFNFTFLSLSAGFLVNYSSMPSYVAWVKNLSFLSYAYQLLMSNEFLSRTMELEDGLVVDGDSVLDEYDVPTNAVTTPATVIVAIAIIYTLISLLALTYIRYPPTGSAGGASLVLDEQEDEREGAGSSSAAAEGESGRGEIANSRGEVSRSAAHTASNPLYSPVNTIEDDDSASEDVEAILSRGSNMRDSDVGDLAADRPGIRIDLRNLCLTVVSQQKPVLVNITAAIRPGRLVAIMGGSGSGKTTLLSLLANRIPHAVLSNGTRANRNAEYVGSGEVLFNGRPLTSSQLRGTVAFVPQFDFHLPLLTARETLVFHASLRGLPLERVDEVLRILGLVTCRHVCVGNGEVKGLSGGERRRLSIAVQLLASPAICLCDEVTTGLDAYTARQVVLLLRNLAHSPFMSIESPAPQYRTVVLSIHQPRYDIFACFDDVILLSRAKVVYAGDRHSMDAYFESLAHPFPALCNPADFLLDISSVDFRSEEKEARSRSLLLSLVEAFSARAPPTLPQSAFELPLTSSKECAPLSRSLPLLFRRSLINLWRQPHLFGNRFSQGVFYALILCAFYAPLPDDQAGVQNRIGALYELTALCFIGMLSCIATYPEERDVFYREYPEGYYTALSHALTYFCIAVPMLLITAVCIAVLICFAIGLTPTGLALLQFSACIFAFMFVGDCIGVAFCAAFQHVGFSVNIMSAVISFLGIMAGYISLDMPVFLDYLAFISPLKWGAFLLTNIAFQGETFDCDANDSTCLSTGDEVLDLYNMNAGQGTRSMMFYSYMLVVITVVYFLLALLAVRLRAIKLSH